MKRIGIIGASFGAILLLTGCGNTETLTCTMEEENYYVKGVMGYKVTYKNDELYTVEQKASIEVTDDEYVSYLDELEKDYEDEKNEGQSAGVNYSLNRKGNNLVMGITYNINKMSEDELDSFGYSSDDDNSYEYVKSQLEDDGYTCK